MPALYQIKNLRQARGGRQVLNIKRLTITQGRVTAIIGANGTGKSSLFDVLALLQPATCDEFVFQGKPLVNGDAPKRCRHIPRLRRQFRKLRRQIGYIQQRPYLLDRSVRENIALGLKFRRLPPAAIDKAVDAAVAELGLRPLLDRPAGRLSGGELQKVALARALALQPQVLIMDEPFTYLDAAAEADLQGWISGQIGDQDGRRTIIFSTHDSVTAYAIAQQVFSVVDGDVYAAAGINRFAGHVDRTHHCFISGELLFTLPPHTGAGRTLLIDPAAVRIFIEEPAALPNRFVGVIVALHAVRAGVHVRLHVGGRGEAAFTAVLGAESQHQLSLQPGQQVWLACPAEQLRLI